MIFFFLLRLLHFPGNDFPENDLFLERFSENDLLPFLRKDSSDPFERYLRELPCLKNNLSVSFKRFLPRTVFRFFLAPYFLVFRELSSFPFLRLFHFSWERFSENGLLSLLILLSQKDMLR